LDVETGVRTELLLVVELGASPAGEPYIVGTAHFRKCIVQLLHHRVDTARRGGGRFFGEEHLALPVVSNVGDVGQHVRVGEVRVATDLLHGSPVAPPAPRRARRPPRWSADRPRAAGYSMGRSTCT